MSTSVEPQGFTVEDLPGLRYGPGRYELVDGALMMFDTGITNATLRDLPDDLNRHELWCGVLVVTPSPARRHQHLVLSIAILLRSACPRDLYLAVAPYDARLGPRTTVQPDILVAEDRRMQDRGIEGPPLLAVEIISPFSRRGDLGRKRDLYAESGCPHYWVVHPTQARLQAFELRDGAYVEVADVSGTDRWATTTPFAVTVCMADLVDAGPPS